MSSLLEIVEHHAHLFRRVVVHPSTNYPGRTQEHILWQLLRKKLEPDVESSAERAREAAAAAGISPQSFVAPIRRDRAAPQPKRRPPRGYDSDEDEEEEEEEDSYAEESEEEVTEALEPVGLGNVWADARAWCMERVAGFIRDEAPDMYTKEEREMGTENVRTGLRRNLEDESDEEEEDEDTDMADAMTGIGSGAGITAAPATQQHAVVGVEPEVLLWCAARGDVNLLPNVDIESRKPASQRR